MDVARLKQGTTEAWSRGDYPAVARVIEPAARELVERCPLAPGQRLLDVGAGTGNVAVLAAQAGASVVATDLTPSMLELGRARSAAEAPGVEWRLADAEELPFADASFDCVTSAFGAMFAPRPPLVAHELFRVVRPGGTVAMASWTPDGYFGRASALTARYRPLPHGVPRPVDWGVEEIVRERFEGLAAAIELHRLTVPFRFGSVEEMWEFMTANVGPQLVTREALDADSYAALRRETLELAAACNRATDGSAAIDSDYLLVVARKPT